MSKAPAIHQKLRECREMCTWTSLKEANQSHCKCTIALN
uniref:Uncharacterized protein n=1 Tax=Anguilla anguilla TaxID=7936 RepID=A0A0E9W5L2_ANGAN